VGGLKKKYEQKALSTEQLTRPSEIIHMKTAAFGADPDVVVPDGFQQLSHGQIGVSAFKLLVSLQLEDELQVLRSHPVVKETIISDLLESGREYMHQKTSDKFFVFQRYLSFGVFLCFPPGRKSSL